MKNHLLLLLLFPLLLFSQQWIRVNQAGYVPDSRKIAVLVSSTLVPDISSFTIHEALTDEPISTLRMVKKYGSYGPFPVSFRLDFSSVRRTGSYYIKALNARSPVFTITPDIYNGSSDHLLRYMRQQRSGFNPYLNDSCHTEDGFIIYHPTLDSTHIDVSGGWHDASDYLQYVTTSATAVYQMLYAYQLHPASFGDSFGADGRPGKNGIPDILDEAYWGLQWLVKMNPQPGMYFNQIADDRDHRGFRLPTLDTVNYGRGKERPVYFINGEPQGIYQYKNRTTGSASTVAKFASAFALGSEILKRFYPEFSSAIACKAIDAYEYAVTHPGVSQTAPCRAPYFYEEDNWVDDAELAASALYRSTGDAKYLSDAVSFGRKEPVTPWMGADTASHYQWYPFTNLGHANIAAAPTKDSYQFISFLRDGIERVYRKGRENPFLFGIPFIWCSNNFVSSFLEQLYLYRTLTHDSTYIEMESSLRDWLFGCNPWGTSMVVGFPAFGDFPSDPHSAFTHVYGMPINGGLIDGPVRSSIFAQHKKYIQLTKADPYAPFQSEFAVYHDDWGDYTNNEPTMDGTASLTMYLSSLEQPQNTFRQNWIHDSGGIIRMDTTKKEIYLVFTGHEFADGAETIISVLTKHRIKASFFFTGDFYRRSDFSTAIRKLKQNGHYLGGHSDKHLLYAPWESRDSLLVSKEVFENDVKDNYRAMKKFGIPPQDAKFFLPPFEWYNQTIADWCKGFGLQLVNFTPGTTSNADYTTPEMPNYRSSDSITVKILRYERNSSNGLNGFILLSHIGTDSKRKDKFYSKLDSLIGMLKQRGYSFKRF